MRACPSCTATQAPQDADVELGVTQCASCGHVFELGASAPPPPEVMPSHEVPPEVRVIDEDGVRTIAVPWRYDSFPLFVLAAPIFALLAMVVAGAAGGPDARTGLGALVPLAAVLYYTAVRLVNRSTLLVADQGLVVTHGPLPWLQAEVALPRDEVLQLFVTEVRTRANKGGSDRFHYSLVARTTKQQLELLSGWNDPELLRGVESAAEARLRIDNHRVGGEHRGEGRGMP